MFSWFKNKAQQEQIKLLYQNNAAAGYLAAGYEAERRAIDAQRMQEIMTEMNRLSNALPVAESDLQALLKINSELRKLYHYGEVNGPEARIRKMLGQLPPSIEPFDGKFMPMEGWESFYKEW